jgi:heme oxygenase
LSLTLEDSAARAGGNRWIEARLFEVTGAWVAGTAETPARLMLDRHSRHHAWRAQQWWDRLPVLADVDRDALCGPPAPAWAAALDHLSSMEPTAARLGALYRVVLPRLHTRYLRQQAQASEGSDGSSIRTLTIVRADVAADWQEGEAQLEELLSAAPDSSGPDSSAPDSFAAWRAVAEIEARLVRVSGEA